MKDYEILVAILVTILGFIFGFFVLGPIVFAGIAGVIHG